MPCLELEAPTASAYSRPDYANDFRCITTACEDTCCSGWTIPIDRRTFESYRAHQVLKPFSALLVLNTETASSGDFARMPLTHEGTCAFLNPQKLCGIHQNLGSSVLSVACNTFPKETSHHLGQPETALNLSCPEAARLVLLDPEFLAAWRADHSGRYARLCAQSDDSDPELAVREFLLLLLTDRRHSLAQRVRLMGRLTLGLGSRHWTRDHPKEVVDLLRGFTRIADLSDRRAECGPAPETTDFAIAVLDERLGQPPVAERFRETTREFHDGMTFARSLPSLRLAAARYLDPFLNLHPHLLENYAANHIFKYSYPFGRRSGDRPADAHLYLSSLLMMVETMLFGSACHHREAFDEARAVKLIQSFSKAIEHRAGSRESLVERARSLRPAFA